MEFTECIQRKLMKSEQETAENHVCEAMLIRFFVLLFFIKVFLLYYFYIIFLFYFVFYFLFQFTSQRTWPQKIIFERK